MPKGKEAVDLARAGFRQAGELDPVGFEAFSDVLPCWTSEHLGKTEVLQLKKAQEAVMVEMVSGEKRAHVFPNLRVSVEPLDHRNAVPNPSLT